MKFIKRLLWLLLLFSAVLGIAGYYKGLRWHNYQAFISDVTGYSKERNEIPDNKQDVKKSNRRALKPGKGNVKKGAIELQPVPKNPFAKIDRYAKQCPDTAEENVKSLADYLQKGAKSDLEKARSVYVWLTENIRYDDDAYNSERDGDNSANGVLFNKKAVCEGFSNLFLALGQEMGLDIEKVSGYAKGYGYTPGMKFNETDHAWNIIRIEGTWKIFDATWGEGNGTNVQGKLHSKKEFDESWFNVDPYESIFSHLPQAKGVAFVQPTISLKKFEDFPNVDMSYFDIGFNGQETYKKALMEANVRFPTSYELETYIKMYTAPTQEKLSKNERSRFEFFIPRGVSAAIIDADNNWTYFETEKGIFKKEYVAETPGTLKISVQYENGGDSYVTVLIYKVE